MTTKSERIDSLLDVLEADELPQGRGELGGYDGGFCFFGTCCKLFEDETGEVLPKDGLGRYLGETGQCSFLEDEFSVVHDYFGFRDSTGSWVRDGKGYCMSRLNDAGHSFPDLARIIKDNREYIFDEED